MLGQWIKAIFAMFEDDNFLYLLYQAEKIISKFLATCLIIVIFVSLFDLAKVLFLELWTEPIGFFNLLGSNSPPLAALK